MTQRRQRATNKTKKASQRSTEAHGHLNRFKIPPTLCSNETRYAKVKMLPVCLPWFLTECLQVGARGYQVRWPDSQKSAQLQMPDYHCNEPTMRNLWISWRRIEYLFIRHECLKETTRVQLCTGLPQETKNVSKVPLMKFYASASWVVNFIELRSSMYMM